MSKKTNAVRLLDSGHVAYELIEYEVDDNDLSATTLAEKLGQDPAQVFKTLVMRGNTTGVFIVVIPGNEEVSLKKAAKASGNKNAEMVHMKELLPLTGYIRGGCSPLAMKSNFPIYIDESCILCDYILISAGKRGMQIKLNPLDLLAYTGAGQCDLTE